MPISTVDGVALYSFTTQGFQCFSHDKFNKNYQGTLLIVVAQDPWMPETSVSVCASMITEIEQKVLEAVTLAMKYCSSDMTQATSGHYAQDHCYSFV